MNAARPPTRNADRATWAIAGAAVLLAGAIGLGVLHPAAPSRGSDRPKAPPSAQMPASPTTVASPPMAELFRTRVQAFAGVEATLRRAFAAYRPLLPHASTAPRLARIQAGSTPQACLTQAIYYEARGEPAEGQAAVAQVVLNRTRSGRHPASVCGVVFEGAARRGCQFSFACDPRLGGRRPEAAAWRRAEGVAVAALQGHEATGLHDALNYHADYVRPGWAGRLQRAAEIGRHIFYAAAPAGRGPSIPPTYAPGD